MKIGTYLGVGGFWFFAWLYRAVVVTLAGGLVGLLVAPLMKWTFFSEHDWGTVFWGSFTTGCHYAGIWASGVAFVWAIIERKRIASAGAKLLTPKVFSTESVS